ncbi:response regulator transcription factor [Bacillus sp. AF23]|uniref:response regulator transcription factor n=1 Tax=Bacillus sp. AF23 TaxID=2821151 RepID=UPI001E5416A4|nr:response regulator transcription factor [Bacillus sp. AF23]MCC8353060.1 response regulator transcription factor [Bacillus sp. AF23]
MYKILLADDERIILDGMAGIIEWETLGASLVGKAQNGIEAYEKIVNKQPHIVITDVKMPGMDGLQLIKKISAVCPSVQFIVLSGFGEFEYAKEAMKYGVRHYLLKPCNEQQIIRSLEEIIAELKRHDVRKKKAAHLKHELNHIRSFAADQYLEGLIAGVTHLSPPPSLAGKKIRLIIAENTQPEDSAAREAFGYALTAFCCSGGRAVFAVEEGTPDLEKKAADGFAGCRVIISRTGELQDAGQLFREATETAGGQKRSELISKITRLVADELGNPNLSLKWAAKDMLFMNPDYVGKIFKQETGEKFSQYVTRVRLEHAMKQMKLRRDVSVSEIAEEIGFGDNPKYFSLVFKKYTGLTPSEFRRKQGGASAG